MKGPLRGFLMWNLNRGPVSSKCATLIRKGFKRPVAALNHSGYPRSQIRLRWCPRPYREAPWCPGEHAFKTEGIYHQFHPAGHDAVPHGDRVARHEGYGQVLGEGEQRLGASVAVRGHRLKTQDIYFEVRKHLANVDQDIEVVLPRQLSYFP